MRKYLVTLGCVLIGVSLSCVLGLSQGKAEFVPTSVNPSFSGEREPLILQETRAMRRIAAAPIDSTPSVDVDIAQLVQGGLTFYPMLPVPKKTRSNSLFSVLAKLLLEINGQR